MEMFFQLLVIRSKNKSSMQSVNCSPHDKVFAIYSQDGLGLDFPKTLLGTVIFLFSTVSTFLPFSYPTRCVP